MSILVIFSDVRGKNLQLFAIGFKNSELLLSGLYDILSHSLLMLALLRENLSIYSLFKHYINI